MANMSYCRFQNTYRDLQDCEKHLDDDLSVSEAMYKEKLVGLCYDVIQECDEMDE